MAAYRVKKCPASEKDEQARRYFDAVRLFLRMPRADRVDQGER